MYVKLGTIGVNYPTTQYNDFMIFSEVPDSTLSYEKPVIVRTLEELSIWFGRSVSDYQQLSEIIRNGGVLYMYKPISNDNRDSSIFDISEYPEVWYDSENKIPLPMPNTDLTYLGGDGEIHSIQEGKKYNFCGTWYILNDGLLIKESELPQNLGNTSSSLNNRDTLLLSSRKISYITLDNNEELFWDGDSALKLNDYVSQKDPDGDYIRCKEKTFIYKEGEIQTSSEGKVISLPESSVLPEKITSKVYENYPKYDHDSGGFVVDLSSDILSNTVINPDSKGNTYAIKIKYPKNTNPNNVLLGEGYFTFTNSAGVTRYFYSGNNRPTNSTGMVVTNASKLGTIITTLTNTRLKGYMLQSGDPMSGEIILYSSEKVTYYNTYSYTNQEISIEVDEDINSKLIYKYSSICNWPNVFFWSKTIGRDSDIYDDSRDISIKLENTEDDLLRLEISRYNYSEIFVGTFDTEIGKESLDNTVSKKSKLINILVNTRPKHFEIQDCEFKLLGAEVEDIGATNYWKSLNLLLDNEGDPVCPDFVMIPDLYNWFPENRVDKKFLDLAKEYNTQFLISESSEGEIYDNLITDDENRLVYFYGDLTVSGVYFPSYYPFIAGVLRNSSVYISKEVENTITFKNNQIYPYIDTEDSLELDKYKCNYLVSNNQRYYYRKYNSGEKPQTTAWRRFIIGKVYRELEKNKWDYLGTRFNGLIRNKIESILRKITNSFSMVKRIEISSYRPIQRLGLIDMTIDVYTTDLVDSNIKLNILINYNKQYE